MTPISTSLSTFGRDGLFSFLKNTAAVAETTPNKSGPATAGIQEASGDPATIIDLSKQAQKIILQMKTEREVADKLQEILQGETPSTKNSIATAATTLFNTTDNTVQDSVTFDRLQVLKDAAASGFEGHNFEHLIEQSEIAKQGGVGWTYRLPSPEANFTQDVLSSLAGQVSDLEYHGKMEEAQKLRDAVANGTLQIKGPDQIEGLDLSYTVTRTQNEFGRATTWNLEEFATGKIKAALDNNLALTRGFGENGAFYFNWDTAEPSA